jgi:hypothetical protein
MSEESKLAGPDFLQGVPLTDITEGGVLLGHAAGQPVLLAHTGREVFAVGARTTMARWPRGCASGIRCAAHGTTPVSTCGPARHCTRRHSTRSLAGG